MLGLVDAPDEPRVGVGVAKVLVADQVGGPVADQPVQLRARGRPDLRRQALRCLVAGTGRGPDRQGVHDLGKSGRVGDHLPAAAERLQVGVDRHTVQSYGLLDRLGRQRQRAGLIGGPDQQHVGELVGAEQGHGQAAGVQQDRVAAAGRLADLVGDRVDVGTGGARRW